jgi:hypothetical protein
MQTVLMNCIARMNCTASQSAEPLFCSVAPGAGAPAPGHDQLPLGELLRFVSKPDTNALRA